jgi:G3E family GTPase
MSTLLTEQVEFADVLVVNKTDLVSPAALASLLALLRGLNPAARVETCVRGRVPLGAVLNTRLFSFGRARAAPGWLRVLRGEEKPETLEYGIGSVVYRSSRPLDPQKLAGVLALPPFADRVVRSKGLVFLASERGARCAFTWSGAGHSFRFARGFEWLCHVDQAQPVDCRTELVLIGLFQDASVPQLAKNLLDRACVDLPAAGALEQAWKGVDEAQFLNIDE